jgi:hypothetical protein
MKWFAHPENVCMSYNQHLKLSLKFCYLMLKGAIKSFIHAFLPDYCVTSTSDIANEIITLLNSNGCHGSKSKTTTDSDKDNDSDKDA